MFTHSMFECCGITLLYNSLFKSSVDFLYTQTCIYISKMAALQGSAWTTKEVELVVEAVKSYKAKKGNDKNWLRTIEKHIWG